MSPKKPKKKAVPRPRKPKRPAARKPAPTPAYGLRTKHGLTHGADPYGSAIALP